MTRRIAITGASGFIGHHLVKVVREKGWRPKLLLRRHPGDLLRPQDVLDVVIGDLFDRAALERLVEGVDAIVHLAGVVKAQNAAEFSAINDQGTERLLAAAAAVNPGAPLVHLSSLAAREPALSPYAASKWAAEEKVARLASARPVAILRPPAVYGPWDQELLPLFRLARLGLLPYPAAPGARFSAIHAADLAGAIGALLQNGWRSGLCLEIDDGAEGGHDWNEVTAILSRLAGKKLAAIRLPRSAMTPIAFSVQMLGRLTGRAMILSNAKLNELYHPDWVARLSLDSPIDHWRPAFPLALGFADSWAWYRAQGLLR